jgi:hypothetical protein
MSSYSGYNRTGCLHQIALQRAITRRSFLRSAAVAGTASRLFGFAPLRAAALHAGRSTLDDRRCRARFAANRAAPVPSFDATRHTLHRD